MRYKCFHWSPKPGPVLVGRGQCAPGGVDAVLVMGTHGCSWAVLPPWTKAEQHQEGSVCFPPCAMMQSLAPEISAPGSPCSVLVPQSPGAIRGSPTLPCSSAPLEQPGCLSSAPPLLLSLLFRFFGPCPARFLGSPVAPGSSSRLTVIHV